MLKLTRDEIVELADDFDNFHDVFAETGVEKGFVGYAGILERDEKYYKVEFSMGVDEYGDLIAWDQDAPEVNKVEVVKYEWQVK